MIMFYEFCHALELIEKSGKNGAKQRYLDVLWAKVCIAECDAASGKPLISRAERPHSSVMPPPFEITSAGFRQRAPFVSAPSSAALPISQRLACRYNMKQPTMAKLFLDVLQVQPMRRAELSPSSSSYFPQPPSSII